MVPLRTAGVATPTRKQDRSRTSLVSETPRPRLTHDAGYVMRRARQQALLVAVASQPSLRVYAREFDSLPCVHLDRNSPHRRRNPVAPSPGKLGVLICMPDSVG